MKVVTMDSSDVLKQAAGLASKISKLHGDVFFERLWEALPGSDAEGDPAVFIDILMNGTAMDLAVFLTQQDATSVAEAVRDTAKFVADLAAEEEDDEEADGEEISF